MVEALAVLVERTLIKEENVSKARTSQIDLNQNWISSMTSAEASDSHKHSSLLRS